MKTRLVSMFGALCTAVALPAFAQPKCTASPCVVTIDVSGSGSTCKIDPRPEPLTVSKVKDASIVWEIRSEGWGFCKILGGGIFLKKPNDGQFYDNYATSDGKTLDEQACKKKYHWKDKNSKPGKYEYRIVIHDGAGRKCELDPAIVNDMGSSP